MSDTPSDEIILRTRGMSMLFPGTVALDNVDYNVWRGKVNVIIGENGAGKSTLMKILAGVQQPSLGEMWLNGKKVHFANTREAAAHGIGMVHQELNLFENLSVAENVFLGRELQKGLAPIHEAEQEKRTAELLARLDQPISPRETVGNLKVGQQQLVEIAKALAEDADILILGGIDYLYFAPLRRADGDRRCDHYFARRQIPGRSQSQRHRRAVDRARNARQRSGEQLSYAGPQFWRAGAGSGTHHQRQCGG